MADRSECIIIFMGCPLGVERGEQCKECWIYMEYGKRTKRHQRWSKEEAKKLFQEWQESLMQQQDGE